MLESLESRYREVQQVILQNTSQELRRLTAVDRELICELIPLLNEFYTATCELEGNLNPNIHQVLPVIACLKKFCEPNATESDSLVVVRSACLECL